MQGARLIHAHFAPDGTKGAKLAQRLGMPLIVTLHGYDITMYQDFVKRYSDLWKEAALFLCVSDFIRSKAIEAGFPSVKLKTHYIGIDTDAFRPAAPDRIPGLVLFVGRLVEKKGCEVLIRAMEHVVRRMPAAELCVIGDGPLRESLSTLSSQLKVPTRFLGALPATEVRLWMQKAAVFCAPSLTAANGDSEGFGMVFLEAQACGTPVVSSLHGGIPEAVSNSVTGTLTPEDDVPALAEAIEAYLASPQLGAQHGANGRAWVKDRYDLFNQTKLLEDIYDEVST
jgi:glycosyltransferase involved in cell wall biosynthesis